MATRKKWDLSIYALILAALISCHPAKKTNTNLSVLTNWADDYSAITSLSNKDKWGPANVHDPSVIKTDSFYYAFSTDAYYIPLGSEFNPDKAAVGHIQIRKSKDLTTWQFVGWALPSIPQAAVEHIHQFTDNKGADGIWAPYILKHGNQYRLYYSVSCFGTNSSYIGMATSLSPEGPWAEAGCVVKTTPQSAMNAIDPSVVTGADGKQWMMYGSYFGGLYCVELNPSTGLTITEGDFGHLVATRAQKSEKIIEAPEIIYQPELKKYFLFVSYDALFTHYNVRVGRSDTPEGPYLDMFGNNMADTTNNYPILTYSYQFKNHPGWSGNAHCGVINDNGKFFMFHQGRLGPDNLMMVMHCREIFWLPSGWPVVSPERYTGTTQGCIAEKEVEGEWEIIELNELPDNVKLWQGQIPPGGWTYSPKEYNVAKTITINKDKTTSHQTLKTWQLNGDILLLNNIPCKVFEGWDWENKKQTILFAGILENGSTIWGKKVNLTK
jgi:arabinan endo-1,5-alpha-L-arabinosidase